MTFRVSVFFGQGAWVLCKPNASAIIAPRPPLDGGAVQLITKPFSAPFGLEDLAVHRR